MVKWIIRVGRPGTIWSHRKDCLVLGLQKLCWPFRTPSVSSTKPCSMLKTSITEMITIHRNKENPILLTGDLVSHISQPSLQPAVLRLSFSQREVSMCRSQFLRDSCALSLFSPSFHLLGTGHKEASERRGLVPESLFGGRMAAKQESPVWTGIWERGKTPVYLRITCLRVLFVAECSSSPQCSPQPQMLRQTDTQKAVKVS